MSSTTSPASVVVEFRSIRLEAEEKIRELEAAEQTDEVRAAISRMRDCVKAVQDICGPDMSIPLVLR